MAQPQEEEEEEGLAGAAQAVLAPSGVPTPPPLGRLWYGLPNNLVVWHDK